ncbi:MAG: S-layer homology domain-containing protein [Phascolarctobacterium sp.]|nr:S-layer homology domain-containing protein [Phascolarctobacterium sp.]
MTKKKKTLRAAVLASIFAMAFSATAWGATYGTVDIDGYGSSEIQSVLNDPNSGIFYDGGWYAPDGKFYYSINGQIKSVDDIADIPSDDRNVLYGKGLDHNEQADSVEDTTKVPSYVGYFDKNGFNSKSVSDMLADNLKFNSDLVRTVSEWEEVNRKATDKYLNEQISQIDLSYDLESNKLTFVTGRDNTNGNPVINTIDLNGLVERDNGLSINGSVLTLTVSDKSGEQVTGRADISSYVQGVVNNSVSISGDTITVNNGGTTQTLTDKYITGFEQIISDKGIISTTITRNNASEITDTLDISDYVKTQILNNAGNGYYNNTTTTINEAITNINSTIGDTNNFNNNIKNEGGTTTTVVEAINNTYDVAKKHNTVIAGDNIIVDSTGTNDDGGIEYKVSLGTELSGLEKVSTREVITEKITLGESENSTAITYEQHNNEYRIKYGDNYVANLNDGMKYGADAGEDLTLNLNEKLNIKGGSNINTIASVVDGIAQIEVNLDENIVVNSVNTQVLYSNNIYSDAATITTIYTDNVYAGAIDTKILYADKIDADEAEIDTLHSKNIYSDSVSTKVLYSDNIYSDAGTIDNLYSNYVDSNVVSTNTLTLKGNSQNTDVTFNDAADGNDGARGRIEYKDSSGVSQQVANLNDGKTFAGDYGSAFVKLQDGVNIIGGANVQNLSEGNIGVIAEANNDGSATLNVKLAKDIAGLDSVESNIVNVNNTLTVGDTNTNITVTKDTININNKTQITENGININNKVIVEENKVDVGGNRIENVADGVNPTDAVNVRQLDKLGNRVDKVGAGAAALAALHPLDFDPDDKLSFSAGVGNYGSETATALGAFYRPSEKVMLSAAGTMGNGENMVNLGVTFALDKTNNVSNSRVAMAREIQDLKSHIVKQDAQIAELIALVGQLTGKSIGQSEDSIMFPDVPENHWAYDYIEGLQKRGIVEGYPNGNFGGDRSMTRYEYAAMLYRALEKGFPVDSRLLDEFDAELGRIRIDRIKGLDDDDNKIERVRVNQYEDRDDYGSKLTAVNEAE